MALKEYYWQFEQLVAATTWDINNVPDEAIRPSITEVFAEGGQIIQPDSQLVSPDGLQLSFGVTPVAGTAMGKYYKEVDDQQVVQDGYGNNVTITVTQNGGGAPSGDTF